MYKKLINILLFLALLYGCSNVAPEKDPFTLYHHLSAEPGTLNPILAQDVYEGAINSYIYETLVDMDKDTLQMKPLLAERWTISPDKLRYIFYLRKDVSWSDGVPFTADDIIYSYKVIMDPATANAHRKGDYMDIKDVRKIGKYTVEFEYRRAYFLGLEICGGMTIIPRHIFNDGTSINSHKNNRFPVGTGPYIFKEWDTGKKIILTRNENYWGGKPEIQRILYKIITEDSVALQMLKKGELDVMSLRPIQWVRQSNSEKFLSNFYKLKYYTPGYRYIGWNSATDFFRDKRVRRAMTYFINRDALLEKLLFGLGKVVSGNFYIFSKAYNSKIAPLEYSPEKGRALLKEAGWTDSDGDGFLDKNGKIFNFVFTIPSDNSFPERLATILKEDLSKVGIEMSINRYEWAVFVEKLNKREFDAVTLGWSLGFNSDPFAVWHSSQIANRGFNFCSFRNKEADTIMEKARTEFNEEKRDRMYNRLHEIIHEEQPYTFMFCSPALVVVSKRFDNVVVHTAGLETREWKVKKQE
ncbi:MAG: peptide-binding protein [Spirochaetes bacterium]|nr:peptide-binding protein [Spirochaetota bacterium]